MTNDHALHCISQVKQIVCYVAGLLLVLVRTIDLSSLLFFSPDF